MKRAAPDAPYLAVARGEKPRRKPVWIMRQAGRYLPEYRAVREKLSFLELCRTPQAAAEVTLQPLQRYDLDAAILFTDLMIPVEAFGLGLRYDPGPVLDRKVDSAAAVDSIRVPDPERDLSAMLETVRLVRQELPEDKALIGFVGAPFTIACYLVEGRGSKAWDQTRRMMFAEPDLFDRLLDKITDGLEPLVRALVLAGCDAVQTFDSWAGVLSADAWATRCAPRTERLIAAARAEGAAAVHFVNGASQHVDAMTRSAADILAVDWRTPMRELRARTGKPLQGNLDPALLFADEATLRREVRSICEAGGDHHVFNLGHGIWPTADPKALDIVVDEVHR